MFTKDICSEFECAIVHTCYHLNCIGDDCYYESFCYVCKKKKDCKLNLFERVGAEREIKK